MNESKAKRSCRNRGLFKARARSSWKVSLIRVIRLIRVRKVNLIRHIRVRKVNLIRVIAA